MSLNRWRLLIMAAYLVLALAYSVATPPFEASDELWHFPMANYLADHGLALPPQTPGIETAWRQEGSQPPLYYMVAALLIAPIDRSDLDQGRQQNPHADIGVVHPDGNINMVIHRPEVETFPWRGALLALHLTRLLSILLGAGTVWMAFSLAQTLFPNRPEVIIGAASLTAFLPMFLFISGSVNNDNLSTLLGNLLTLQVVRLLRAEKEPSLAAYIGIGGAAGAGLLAKFNIGFMLPLIALSLALLSARLRSLRPLIVGGLISGSLTIAIAGWWYWRNFQLYGDPTGLNTFLDIVGRRAIPANLAQLWAERHSFLQAFWGFFGGVNVPLPVWAYAVFDALGLAGLIGSVLFAVRAVARARRADVAAALPYAFTLLWIALNFASYLRWTAETPASQGRLMFGALASISMWLAVGIAFWVPHRARAAAIGLATAWFAGMSALAPFMVIAPAYAPPAELPFVETAGLARFTSPAGGAIRLVNATVASQQARPDEYVVIDLTWQVEAPFERDWSLFIHLVTPEGVIIGQRDIFPGAGAFALSAIPAGRAWAEQIAVRVPPNAYAPQTVDVVLGWYHLSSGDRLRSDDAADTTAIGTTAIAPRISPLDVPNPSAVNFGGLIELAGYRLSDLSAPAGGTLELTLFWRALSPIPRDYIVFAHIVEPASMRIYAGSDAMPAAWARPTTTWAPGEIIEDRHTLAIDPATPPVPGIYEVEIGLYLNPGDGTFPRLRVVTPDGGMASDFTYLSRVRVLPRQEAGS